ncbi:rubrerythrin-related [Anaeramoeba ignava]|uniref:Rubrerythrin-related n=1 Tax=Anaeramoeba ignava TaxID=1746090 RepID=A0A9Q0R653_ANAIG|nr:rubrerythrin-related [Anaeramoeba ignava]
MLQIKQIAKQTKNTKTLLRTLAEKIQNQLKGSKTQINLMTAFAGESQARNRYTYFAAKAFQEGYVQISNIFEETANQEKEHAKRLFSLMKGGKSKIHSDAEFDFGKVGKTVDNLLASAEGEGYEHTIMYPEFAKVAREEGFEDIAKIFEAIAVAEKQHQKRFLDLAKNIKEKQVFSKEKVVIWRCLNCGYLHWAKDAPNVCPACGVGQKYFEVLGENW